MSETPSFKQSAVRQPLLDPNHSRTVKVWEGIFRRSNINLYPSLADLCPGDDPKVESGLLNAGFKGKLLAVDSSESRLGVLEDRMGDVPFSFIPQVSLL